MNNHDPRDDEIKELNRELADAKRVIAILLERNGGEVAITEEEVITMPLRVTLTTHTDATTGDLHISVTKSEESPQIT